MRKRLANAYLSSVISISLVLLLVGVGSLLLVNARGISNYFKENLELSVVMNQEVSEKEAVDFMHELDTCRFINSARFVSREQGVDEMTALMGEDFLSVFATAPIPISIDLTLTSEYVSHDKIQMVVEQISKSSLVEEVIYQESLVDSLNANMNKISLLIGVFILLLLFISFVLINNTVRLSIYARRFTIHTMQMVGATRSFIRKPFLLQSVFQGLFASLISIIALLVLLFFVKNEFIQLFQIFHLKLLLLVISIVIVSGVVICILATCFAVNKMISLKKSELYF